MNIIQTILVAFSMFSSLPVPFIPWEKKNTTYLLLAFPLVGLFCGGVFVALCHVGAWFVSSFVLAVLLALAPIILTGGLHLDGYCDYLDAHSSHQSKEKKLEILSDPHIGAFAVMGLVCYLLLSVAILYELDKSPIYYPFFVGIFFISRCLSALSVVSLPKAKTQGLVATFSKDAHHRHIQGGLGLTLLCTLLFFLFYHAVVAIPLCLVGTVVFFRWKRQMLLEFQGITGDLTGYLVQKLELYLFLTLMLVQKSIFFSS